MSESIIFSALFERPVEAWFMPHPSIQSLCIVRSVIGTDSGGWLDIEVVDTGEFKLVPAHQVSA